MDAARLAHLDDVTRRYGRYRPCGAGLGVAWGGLLLALLGLLVLRWTRSEYAAHAVASQTFWRFLRGTPLLPPAWLQIAAIASPFVAWAGLLAIQGWVDRRFGAVTVESSSGLCRRPRGPRWLPAFMVAMMASLLSVVLIWDVGTAALRPVAAMIALGAWPLVWGRGSRDQLTLLVMFAVSVPSLYLVAAASPGSNLASGSLIIFVAYFVVMLFLLAQGGIRFLGFLKVRAELDAMKPVEE